MLPFNKITDLTLPFVEGMRGYSREISKTVENEGWNASTIHLYSHAGTHMDAPYHFGVSDKTIDQQKLSNCIVEACLVKVAEVKPKMVLTPDLLKDIKLPDLKNKGVLFQTNWSRYAGDMEKYRNQLPRIGVELAEYLVSAEVKLVGVEPPSVADVNNIEELTKVHHILLEKDITIVEGLTNLEQISSRWFTFIALPLKIKNGDGFPVRALALE